MLFTIHDTPVLNPILESETFCMQTQSPGKRCGDFGVGINPNKLNHSCFFRGNSNNATFPPFFFWNYYNLLHLGFQVTPNDS